MLNTSRRVFVSCSVGFLFLAVIQTAGAAPPSPPPSTASGIVYFEYGGTVMQMRGDGSQKAVAIPANLRNDMGLASPSNLTYGSKPWWLTVEEVGDGNIYPWGANRRELYVSRIGDGGTTRLRVQLTDLFQAGIAPYMNASGFLSTCWSNDNLDTFLSFVGINVNDPQAVTLFKVPFRVTAGNAPGIDMTRLEEIPLLDWRDYHWSPVGQTMVYQFTNSSNVSSLLKHSLGDPLPTTLWMNSRTSSADLSPQWSPTMATEKVAFSRFRSTLERDVLTVNSNGGGEKVVLTARSRSYATPFWAPLDGAYLVAKETDVSKSTWKYQLVQAPSGGGARVILTADLDSMKDKHLLAWRCGLEYSDLP